MGYKEPTSSGGSIAAVATIILLAIGFFFLLAVAGAGMWLVRSNSYARREVAVAQRAADMAMVQQLRVRAELEHAELARVQAEEAKASAPAAVPPAITPTAMKSEEIAVALDGDKTLQLGGQSVNIESLEKTLRGKPQATLTITTTSTTTSERIQELVQLAMSAGIKQIKISVRDLEQP